MTKRGEVNGSQRITKARENVDDSKVDKARRVKGATLTPNSVAPPSASYLGIVFMRLSGFSKLVSNFDRGEIEEGAVYT